MEFCELEATVPTGFEKIAAEEVKELFGVTSILKRGNISFHVPIEKCCNVLQLHSIDNISVVINRFKNYNFSCNKDECLSDFKALVPDLDWEKGIKVWSKFFTFDYPISPTPVDIDKEDASPREDIDIEKLRSKEIFRIENELAIVPEVKASCSKSRKYIFLPAFRTTCHRTGQNHSFGSNDAAAAFGGAINDYFHWNVDMIGYDIETLMNIDESSVSIGIALTRHSLHKRNLCQLGPTTLRATICYNMLRLCDIQPGEVVCDPMCGGGSISIEGAISYSKSHHICGDNHPLAGNRSVENIKYCDSVRKKKSLGNLGVDVVTWDVCRLPLRDNCTDVFITDLPFGKRLGSKSMNRGLYPKILTEMARVCRPQTSRACLLTQDKKNIVRAFSQVSHLWRQGRIIGTNIGGLAANVYLLHRTMQLVTDAERKPKEPKSKKRKTEKMTAPASVKYDEPQNKEEPSQS